MRRAVPLLLLAVAAMAFAPAPFARPPRKKEPPPSLLGKWDQVNNPTVLLVLTPTTLEYHNRGSNINAYEMTFDPKVVPPTYDIQKPNGQLRFSGIWKVEGDKLTLYYRSGTVRPASFEDGNGFREEFVRAR